MDVTLVLTHRCNLDCRYCYAGEHHRRDIEDDVIDRGVELLFAGGSGPVQLSFFGGEPLLAFDAMQRAIARARARAAAEERPLEIQCTTNGAAVRPKHVELFRRERVHVTVSIDGVAEAHDLNRPRAGGGSSFAQVHRGLRLLLDADLDPDAMMVITPQTIPHVYRSVSWLWSQGVRTVRANLELDAPWGRAERDELGEQLVAVASELCARRKLGEMVRFEPFERGMAAAGGGGRRRRKRERKQVVVGVTGNLYPCAPMVGEDRDDGPEAALRIGHLDDGPAAAVAACEKRGAGCSNGGACACAAYLETGDRERSGPVGLWYAATCRDIGAAVAAELSRATPRRSVSGRRLFMIGVAAAASGLALAVPMALTSGDGSGCRRPFGNGDPDGPVPGEMRVDPEPPPQPAGAIAEPEPPPPPEPTVKGDVGAPEPDVDVEGDIGPPDDPAPDVLGDVGAPEPKPEPTVRGNLE